jgi:TonB family protein
MNFRKMMGIATLIVFTVVVAVASVLLFRRLKPVRLTTAELESHMPKPPFPKPVSIGYAATLPTLWHVENCFPPADGYFGFKATATEFRSVQRNPKVSFRITGRGTVDDAELLQGSGSPGYDKRLMAWLQAMRFQVKSGCEIPWRGTGLVNVEF